MDLFVLKKIKEGDIKAFESIFRLYYTPLCLYATSITGEQEVAEEIVQDLFYVFWKERESLPILRSIRCFLCFFFLLKHISSPFYCLILPAQMMCCCQ